MLREALRVILILLVVVAAAAFFLGYRWAVPHGALVRPAESPVATSGQAQDNRVERARETGAEIGEKVAVGAQRAGQTLEEAGLTAKVKSKIALDDTLKGSHVEVSTTNAVVTLSGTVAGDAQHRRVLALARETDGVMNVVDHLIVGGEGK